MGGMGPRARVLPLYKVLGYIVTLPSWRDMHTAECEGWYVWDGDISQEESGCIAGISGSTVSPILRKVRREGISVLPMDQVYWTLHRNRGKSWLFWVNGS